MKMLVDHLDTSERCKESFKRCGDSSNRTYTTSKSAREGQQLEVGDGRKMVWWKKIVFSFHSYLFFAQLEKEA